MKIIKEIFFLMIILVIGDIIYNNMRDNGLIRDYRFWRLK